MELIPYYNANDYPDVVIPETLTALYLSTVAAMGVLGIFSRGGQ